MADTPAKQSQDNFYVLRGAEIFTMRFTSIPDTGAGISIPVDAREVLLHYEGTTVIGSKIGGVAGSTEVFATSNGYSEILPISVRANQQFAIVKAKSGTTLNLSVTAWR